MKTAGQVIHKLRITRVFAPSWWGTDTGLDFWKVEFLADVRPESLTLSRPAKLGTYLINRSIAAQGRSHKHRLTDLHSVEIYRYIWME